MIQDSPDFRHPDYETALPRWRRCRDAIAGQDAVHQAGEYYLPKLTDQEGPEYTAYKQRTPFYNASGRTLDGLVGMVFRKEPLSELPAAMEPWAGDITLSGVSLSGLARDVIREVQEVGRCGVLVEYPRVTEQPTNLAGALAMNLRPYATLYKAESIINWRVERINNRMQPTMIVLAETYEVRGNFATEAKEQVRVLALEDGAYVQRLYRQDDKQKWQELETLVPTRNGAPLTELPFFPFGPDSLSMAVQQPPLLDLVDINLSHYRTSADLEHGAHFTGLPTPFISGHYVSDGEKVRIGSATAIVVPAPDARASYLEFTGQGLGALEKLLDRKEAQMAAIGARMLAPEKRSAETAGTVEMRHSGESSVLASMARLTSTGLTAVLQKMADWAGIPGEPTMELSTDYMPAKMSAQELTALVSAWQAGAISTKTLFWNLQSGEVINASTYYEEHQGDIDGQGPTLGAMNDGEPTNT